MPRRLITAGYVGLIFASGWAVNHASEQRSEQKLRTLERACNETGNPGRALDHLEATHTRPLRETLQPILDCHATYVTGEGKPVPLRLNQQRLFVRWISRGVRPVVRADGTVSPR